MGKKKQKVQPKRVSEMLDPTKIIEKSDELSDEWLKKGIKTQEKDTSCSENKNFFCFLIAG